MDHYGSLLQHYCYPQSYWPFQRHIRLWDFNTSPTVHLEIKNDLEKEAVDLNRLCHRFPVSELVDDRLVLDSHPSLSFLSNRSIELGC